MTTSTRREWIAKAAALGIGAVTNRKRMGNCLTLDRANQSSSASDFLPGFEQRKRQTSGAMINFAIHGTGPAVLLLHGYPQTHIIWRKVAVQLAQNFTVVASDLRGYGDSSKPEGEENHSAYSKRSMARDQVELMASLGFKNFAVVGHDRGGRVAHRMALDHADVVSKLVLLDIVPTHKLYHSVTKEFASAYFHWFFLIQPAPFPETLIGGNVEFYLRNFSFGGLLGGAIDDRAFAEYLRCFRDPATIHASCEDYRAAATIDLEHDAVDLNKKIACPTLVLWGEQGAMHPLFNVHETWKERVSNVKGRAIPGGHFLPEESPQVVLEELSEFL